MRFRLGRAAAVMLLAAGGCARPPAPKADSVSATAERGPLKLVVNVTPRSVWLGDPVTIETMVEAPAEYLVQFEPLDLAGELSVRDVEKRDPRPASKGGLEWRQRVVVDSFASGEHQIPPVVVKYARAPEGDGKPAFDSELVTNPLTIEVRSALTSQDSPAQPRDIAPPLMPPWRLRAGDVVLWGGVAAAAIGAGVVAWWFVRRMRGRSAPPIPPEVWALRELTELGRGDWVESGRAREYYYRLTEIVRGYVERKFGLAAPDMTTEEFLRSLEAPRRDDLTRPHLPYDKTRLRYFLEACDLVKYAAFEPRRQEADDALFTARAFVDATAAAAQTATVNAPTAPPPSGDPNQGSGGRA